MRWPQHLTPSARQRHQSNLSCAWIAETGNVNAVLEAVIAAHQAAKSVKQLKKSDVERLLKIPSGGPITC